MVLPLARVTPRPTGVLFARRATALPSVSARRSGYAVSPGCGKWAINVCVSAPSTRMCWPLT
ncbi:hypothetical protein ACFPM0_20355 [Pseudonocardia sulfidoxydans]|uniref:hypothetical protein n=1 Tax=Pseudonocardia sulfidoxydans TaxID=54011 RepID=UPI0036155E9C